MTPKPSESPDVRMWIPWTSIIGAAGSTGTGHRLILLGHVHDGPHRNSRFSTGSHLQWFSSADYNKTLRFFTPTQKKTNIEVDVSMAMGVPPNFSIFVGFPHININKPSILGYPHLWRPPRIFSALLRFQMGHFHPELRSVQLPPQQRLRLRLALLDCRSDLLLRGGSKTGTGGTKLFHSGINVDSEI